MATITQRIALTGDQEIKNAFDALGATVFKRLRMRLRYFGTSIETDELIIHRLLCRARLK